MHSMEDIYSEKNINFFKTVHTPTTEICNGCKVDMECGSCYAIPYEHKLDECDWYSLFKNDIKNLQENNVR